MENIKISVVVLNNNVDNLINCLDSIQKQDYSKENIEVILETLELDEEIKNRLNNYKFKLVVRKVEELNTANCYNDGLEISTGDYIMFTNSNITFDDNNALSTVDGKVNNTIIDDEEVEENQQSETDNNQDSNEEANNEADDENDNLENNDDSDNYGKSNLNLIVCRIRYYDSDLDKYTDYILTSKRNKTYYLEKISGDIKLCLESYFINKKLLIKIKFDTKFNDECKEKLILDLYQKNPLYLNKGSISLTSISPFEDNFAKNSIQYDPKWYNESLVNWTNYLSKLDYIPVYVQEAVLYMLYAKINCNIEDRDKYVLDEEAYELFLENAAKLLRYIDDKIIMQGAMDSEFKKIVHKFSISRALKIFLYKLKNQNSNKSYVSNNIIYERSTNSSTAMLHLNGEKINVYAINYDNGKLTFDCTVGVKDYLKDSDIDIKIVYGDEIIPIKKTEVFSSLKMFGKTYTNKYTFRFSINVKNNYKTLKAFILYNKKDYRLKFNFVKVQSRLSNSKRAYWAYKDFIIQNKKTKLVITKRSSMKRFKLELKFLLSKLKNEPDKKNMRKLTWLRILYFLTKPFLSKKHIWVAFDKLYKAGDDGEYIYQYSRKMGYNNIYYIVKKDSPDYKRLVKEDKKHILVFGSIKAKLYALHAEAILKTHANILGFLGFDGLARIIIRDLFNAEIIEICHGLTMQDIPQYQNRLVDNNKLYFCASKYEYQNIIQPMYGYTDDQIKVVGLTRFDGLKSNDQKIILITPTWRHSVAAPSVKHGTARGHNDLFKNTEYFRIYNTLINDKKLIKCAEETGYRIVFLLHPTLSGQLEDFDKNNYVDIIPAAGDMSYEKILTESSLMVTDYSGVQYDFAYQKKPVVYFHPDELPPHYGLGTMNYETMGFGPIIKTVDGVVNELCDAMKNKCKNKEEYIKRVEDFFEYDDFKTCERTYNLIEEYMKKIRK